MNKIKRQKIKLIVADISPWDLTGDSEKIYAYLLDIERSVHKKYGSSISDLNWDWESPSEGYSNGRFVLECLRLETDKEYNLRVKKLMKIKDNEQKEKEQQEQKDYEIYLKLKKKFDKNRSYP
jgi:hypothetical protein